MTVQEILNELDAYGYQDTDLNEKMRAINASIKSIASRKPWPWLHKVTSLTFDGTNPYPTNTPSDLRAVLKVIDTSTGRRVRYKSVDEVEEQYGAHLLDAGTPYLYYFEGTQLRVYQVPGASQTLRLRYVSVPANVVQADPESAIAVPPIGHEALVFRTVMRIADVEDDNDIAARYGALYEQEMQVVEEALGVQQFDAPEHILVVDVDDYDYL
jgi:hypothetical protein